MRCYTCASCFTPVPDLRTGRGGDPSDIGQERADCAEIIKSLAVRLSSACAQANRLGIEVRMDISMPNSSMVGQPHRSITLDPRLSIRL